MIEIRLPRTTDAAGCAELAALVVGEDRAGPLIKSHLERHHLIVAEADKEIVGFLAYRTDWFQCTFVSLVVVREDFRRKGIARESSSWRPTSCRPLRFPRRRSGR